jgi:hypothetical protein
MINKTLLLLSLGFQAASQALTGYFVFVTRQLDESAPLTIFLLRFFNFGVVTVLYLALLGIVLFWVYRFAPEPHATILLYGATFITFFKLMLDVAVVLPLLIPAVYTFFAVYTLGYIEAKNTDIGRMLYV